MKSKLFIGILAVGFCCITACNHNSHTNGSSYSYDEFYKDSFEFLLNSCSLPHTIVDTMYVEMYIAFKTYENQAASKIFFDRNEKLMSLDTNVENKLMYLDMKKIILSLQEKRDEYNEASYQYWCLLPENSIDRVSGLLGYYYFMKKNEDSVAYYASKAILVADSLQYSKNDEERETAIISKLISFALLKKDDKAIKYLDVLIKDEKDEDMKEMWQEFRDDFSSFKKEFLNMN